jgi:hypothetical protein
VSVNAISTSALSGLEKERDPPLRKGAVSQVWPAESMGRCKMWVVFETVIAGGTDRGSRSQQRVVDECEDED